MKMQFKAKRFLTILILIHLLPYLCWSFILLSFTEPFITTFTTESSRGSYIFFLMALMGITAPIYLPFVDDEGKKV